MLGTAEAIPTTVAPPGPPVRRALGDLSSRAAGFGALAFVGVVILQNALRGSSAPIAGATNDEVLSYYTDHRTLTFVLVTTFVLSGTSLAVFLGGALRRLVTSTRPGWAYTGLAGALGVMTLFAVMLGCEQALSVVADGATPDAGAVEALWALHNSVFTVLWLSIGVALLGLARAGVAAGITPAAFDRLAPIGFALLALGTAAGPATAAGDATPFVGLGLIGFLIWLAFLTTTGLRLVRAEQVTA